MSEDTGRINIRSMAEMEIIKNKAELSTSLRRWQALEIVESGIRRVLPSTIMIGHVSFDPHERSLVINRNIHRVTGRIFLIGGGKASGLMAEALERILGPENIEAGIVVDKSAPEAFRPQKIRVVQAGHPLPNHRGMEAVQEIFRMKDRYTIGQDDTILCLLSGGASSLMPFPAEGVSLSDKQKLTQLLLACGASIHEINSVRKHISQIKGGRLARHFAPARIISLILSDVLDNDLSVIASGPAYPDPSTYAGALAVLRKYGIGDAVPASILKVLDLGIRGRIEETPRTLDNVSSYILGDIRSALEAMAGKAGELGFRPVIISSTQKGDTETAAGQRAGEIRSGTYDGHNALIIGGETTPRLPPQPGKGGRNQHYAAATPLFMEGYPRDWVLVSVGTDGSDYLPDVAGAIVDQDSLAIFRTKVPDYKLMLENFDSYTLLQKAGSSLVITGDTHTNVGDVMVYLI